jgi:hypothetical protein
MVQRALCGLPPAAGPVSGDSGRLFALWHAAWRAAERDLPLLREVECTLGVRLPPHAGSGSARLLARFDLIAVEPGRRAVILDWKSGGVPARERLRARVQSRLLPYIVVEASPALPWGPLLPAQVELHYWFAAAPGEPVILRYNDEQHAAQHEWLRALLTSLRQKQVEDDFPPAPDDEATPCSLCTHCIYRSRCGRDGIPVHFPNLVWEPLAFDSATALFGVPAAAELA